MTDKTDALVARLQEEADRWESWRIERDKHIAPLLRQAAEALAAPTDGGQPAGAVVSEAAVFRAVDVYHNALDESWQLPSGRGMRAVLEDFAGTAPPAKGASPEAVAEYQYRCPKARDNSWTRMSEKEYEATIETGRACGHYAGTYDVELRKLYTTPRAASVDVEGLARAFADAASREDRHPATAFGIDAIERWMREALIDSAGGAKGDSRERVLEMFLGRIFAAQRVGDDGEYKGWKIAGRGSLNEVVDEARDYLNCPLTNTPQPGGGDGAAFPKWVEVTVHRGRSGTYPDGSSWGSLSSARVVQIDADDWREFVAKLSRPSAAAAVPEGFVLVPEKMHVEPAAWDAAQFVFGGPGTGEGEEFMPCTLWIGEIDNEDGSPPVYGLHASCDECPEAGSTTLAEFAAAPAAPNGGVDEAMVERACFVYDAYMQDVHGSGNEADDYGMRAALTAALATPRAEQDSCMDRLVPCACMTKDQRRLCVNRNKCSRIMPQSSAEQDSRSRLRRVAIEKGEPAPRFDEQGGSFMGVPIVEDSSLPPDAVRIVQPEHGGRPMTLRECMEAEQGGQEDQS